MICLIKHLNKDDEESQLIESFIKWRKYDYECIHPGDQLMRYYRGTEPVILLLRVGEEPMVFYGFTSFVPYACEYRID